MIGFRNNEIGRFVVISKIYDRIIDGIHIDTELVFDNHRKIYAIGLEYIAQYIRNENYSTVWVVHSEKKPLGQSLTVLARKQEQLEKKKKTKNRIFKK
jgi:hypothetical protein